MTKRATGRTYRKALQAALDASNGKSVLWLVGNCTEYAEVHSTLNSITHGKAIPSGKGFCFPGKGDSITLALASSNFSGMRYDAVVLDELLGMTYRDIEGVMDRLVRIKKS